MRNIEHLLVSIFRVAIGISFAALIVVVLTQVLARTYGTSPVWTEELTRYSLLYLAAFGAGLAYKSGDLVNVDIFCEAFGEVWSRRLRLFSAVLTAIMCFVLLVPAWRYVEIGAFQTSPAMGLQMTYVHLSVFALLLILFLFASLRIVAMVVYKEDGRPTSFKDFT